VEQLNVLITAGSRRVPLVRAFQAALRSACLRGRVIVTDINPLSPAVHAVERWYQVPLSTEPGYIEAIETICAAEQIGLVVPTIDEELPVFAEAAIRLLARGVRVAVSPESTSRICNDKLETCRHLSVRGIRAATTMLPGEVPETAAFPLFIKPRYGRGAVGAFPLRSRRDLEFFSSYVEQPVVQEYLDGREFTIDVLCNFRHEPLAIVPRERVSVRAGVTDRGRTVHDHTLIALGEAVVRALPFTGAANIQCRVQEGQPVVFEVNARFSGGIPLTIAAGADFPRYLLELAVGHTVPPRIGHFTHDMWMTTYDQAFFLHGNRTHGARPSPAAIGAVA
jgi:carbamoyl-phosphate synthase large subunit